MFWNREEVFMTFEQEKYVKARDILVKNGISYKRKIKLTMGKRNSHRLGSLGTLGEDDRYSTIYYLYTDKSAAERARYLIRSELLR